MGGAEVALSTGIGLLSGMGSLMDADFGGVSESFRAFRAAMIPLPNAIRHACLAGSVDKVGAEVVSVDKVVAKGTVACVVVRTAPTGKDTGLGAELDMIQSFVVAGKGVVAENAAKYFDTVPVSQEGKSYREPSGCPF